jgi:hypothetical protein
MVVTPDLLCGLHSVVSLCLALQIPVDSSPLDCDPFCHVYGNECSYARITIGTWNLCLIDLNGIHPFLYCSRSRSASYWKLSISHSDIKGPDNLLNITPSAGLSLSDLVLQTYTTGNLRTHLFVVPSRKEIIPTYFSSVSLFSSCTLSLL